MTIDTNSRESRALAMMRFPLACLIVLLHTGVNCGPENLAWYVPNYFASAVVTVAVPSFFFISGYLFFIGKERFDLAIYAKTLKKKVRSLLVPYLIWNLVAYVLGIAYEFLTTKTVADSVAWTPIEMFWSKGEGLVGTSVLGYRYVALASPCAGVLWFVRDLMMMMVCTIVTYPIIKKLKWWIFPVLFIVYALRLGVPFAGFSLAAITFFHMGAVFSIHQINIFAYLKKWGGYFVWPTLIIVRIVMNFLEIESPSWFDVIYLATGILFVFHWAYDAAEKEGKSYGLISKWGETSFFIYTFAHTLIVWFVNKEPGYMLNAIPCVGPLLCYLFLFTARVAESVGVFYVMKKYCPTLLGVLIGGCLNKNIVK